MNYNLAVMKMEVKQALRRTRPHPMLVTLLYSIILGAGTQLISQTIAQITNILFSGGYSSLLEELSDGITKYGEDYLEYYLEQLLYSSPQVLIQIFIQAAAVTLLTGILTAVWSGLMNVGYAGYCLDMSRGMNPQLGQIFSGFPLAGSAILAYILVTVFTFLWSLLFGIGLVVLFFIAAVLIAVNDALAILGILLMLAALILYVVAIVWVSYRYVMVPFAVADSQNPMSAMDAINASKAMMKGRKGSFFVLRLSFIGWYLLEAAIAVVAFVIFLVVMFMGTDAASLNGSAETAVTIVIFALGFLVLVAVVAIASGIINLWLIPYRTGCEARFYLYASGSTQPIQPPPYQPSPYSGQPGPYGNSSGYYSGQSSYYGGQSDSYSGQSGSYGGQPGPYGGQPGPYGGQPGQSSFGGYTQVEQPPQYGTGISPQWGAPPVPPAPPAPQPPQAPPFSTTGPLTGADEVPGEPDNTLYEAPYADESEAPDGDTPQRPSGPSYPQY